MLNLLLKTDQPLAKLYLYEDKKLVCQYFWQADRSLAETLNQSIERLLTSAGKSLADLDGIGIFSGPGSFTGLRIGHAVGNALAYALDLPIDSAGGKNWQQGVLTKLLSGKHETMVLPNYGRQARITKPRK